MDTASWVMWAILLGPLVVLAVLFVALKAVTLLLARDVLREPWEDSASEPRYA